MIKRILLIAISLILISCDNDDKKSGASAFTFSNADYEQLINDLNDLQIAISLKQVLNNNPERQRAAIDSALSRARGGLLILAKTGPETEEDKRLAYQQFTDAIRQYDSFRILEFEQERFDLVFNQVRYIRYTLARDLNLKTDDETWTIYNHNFSTSGLEPDFTTLGYSRNGKPNDEAKWFTNFQIDLPKARVQGRDGAHGWLISRPFDLSRIENPSFRHFGSYLVVAPNNFAPLSFVLRNVFKTYILIDYKVGDNPDEYEEGVRKFLVNYDLDDLPLGRDFHDEWSPLISLEEHKTKGDISIAYLFDSRRAKYKSEKNGEEIEVGFTQYYSWTIFDFELHGAGKIQEDLLKYKSEFIGSSLGNYKSYSLEFPGENWSVESGRLSLTSKGDKVDTFLLSPKFDIPKSLINPNLLIRESFLKEGLTNEKLSNLEVLISKDFKGGQSPLNATWDKVEHGIDLSTVDPESTSKFLSNEIALSLNDYSGEEITLAFRFKSPARESQTKWSVESIKIFGEGGEVTEIDYALDNPGDAFNLASYNMGELRVSNFKIEEEENAPTWRKDKGSFIISGYGGSGNPPKTGISRLILPKEIDLSGKTDARIRMRHKVFFFKDPVISPQVTRVQIKVSGDDTAQWQDLEFPEGTFRDQMPRDPELSRWAQIPSEFLDKKVLISFKYQAQAANGGTVEWTLNSVEVGAK